jgi:hypothetical protein
MFQNDFAAVCAYCWALTPSEIHRLPEIERAFRPN